MLSKGEIVVYGSAGVCRVEDIREESLLSDDDVRLYYIIRSVSDSKSTVFVPVDREATLRPVLSENQVNEIIDKIKDKSLLWIADGKTRTAEYGKILSEGSRSDVLLLIKCLREKKSQMRKMGKRFYIADEKMLSSAERMINSEFSYILGIEENQVGDYIKKKIS